MLVNCDSFFFYSNTIFIDVFKCNKYKKHIIQCFFTFAFRLLLDLYIKLLKQALNYFSYVITNILNELMTGRNSQLYWIFFCI